MTQLAIVSLTHLVRSSEYQVRKKLDPVAVTRYETTLKAGGTLPPVTVADVEGVLILVDGFHRVEARERLGEGRVEAEIIKTSKRDAKGMAAMANLQHGLPLKNSEIRRAFGLYIEARRHVKTRKQLKSYREIGQELGKPHTTIRQWMQKDFPRIFKQYSGDEDFRGEGGLVDIEAIANPATEEGLRRVDEFREIYQSTTCGEARRELEDAYLRLARELLGEARMQLLIEDF